MGILRLLLAFAVVSAHCGKFLGHFKFVNGAIALESFFMMSGFYMSLVLNKKYPFTVKGYWLFISNRLLRLYPLYWTVAILTLLLLCLNLPSIQGDYSLLNSSGKIYMYITNGVIFMQELCHFMGLDPSTGGLYFTHNFWESKPLLYKYLLIPQAWSLALELIFYLLVPFLVRLSSKQLVALGILSLLIRMFVYYGLHWKHDPWTFRFFPSELLFFVLGILAHRHQLQFKNHRLMAYTLLGILILYSVVYPKIPDLSFPYVPFTLKGMSYLTLIFVALPIVFNQFKNNSTDRYISELSYPFYISHIFIDYLTQIPVFSYFHNGTWIILLTLLFSILLMQTIVLPIEKYRQSRFNKL